MERSESIKNLAEALCKFQGEVPVIPFDCKVKVVTKSGSSYTFDYATMKSIKETCKPFLLKYGLSVSQFVGQNSITTILTHSSGEFLLNEADFPGSKEPTIQEYGSVITHMKRYCYSAVLGLVSDEDDDGNIGDGNDVKEKVTKDTRPWLNKSTKDDKGNNLYKRAENHMQTGGDISKIEENFKLSKEMKAHLESLKP